MLNTKYEFITPYELVDLSTGESRSVPAAENCNLSIDGVISINPTFKKSKRLIEYQKAKELREDLFLDVNYFDSKANIDKINELSTLKSRLHDAELNVDRLKQSFIYDKKNKSSDGFTLNDSSRKKLRRNLHWLYQNNKSDGVKFLWYTFTCPSRFVGVGYRPEEHDRLVSDQFQKLLENVRRNWGIKEYIFVAERQDGKRIKKREKNATNAIHFHVVFVQDSKTFFDVQRVNAYWCALLGQVGFEFINLDLIDKQLLTVTTQLNRLGNLQSASTQLQYDEIKKLTASFNFLTTIKNSKGDYQKLSAFLPKDFRNIQKGNPWYRVFHNPVDGKLIGSFKQLGVYIAKYMGKCEHKIYCRCWSQTRYFSNLVTQINVPLELAFSEIIKKHKTHTHTTIKDINGIKYHWYRHVYNAEIWNHPLLKAYLNYLLNEQTNKKTTKESKTYYTQKLWGN